MHQDLIFHTPGRVGPQTGTLAAVEGGDAFDQADGSDGDQILLVGPGGIILLVGVRLVEIF